jgi:hypothetical protein
MNVIGSFFLSSCLVTNTFDNRTPTSMAPLCNTHQKLCTLMQRHGKLNRCLIISLLLEQKFVSAVYVNAYHELTDAKDIHK